MHEPLVIGVDVRARMATTALRPASSKLAEVGPPRGWRLLHMLSAAATFGATSIMFAHDQQTLFWYYLAKVRALTLIASALFLIGAVLAKWNGMEWNEMDLLFLLIIGGLVIGFGAYLATRETAPSEKKETGQHHAV